MFKFCNLYSGSSGNCSFAETDNTKVLIDCGVSSKKVEEGLSSINVDIKDIDAILLTHEHTDHVRGLAVISKKYHIPIYANLGTFENINLELPESVKHFFKTNEKFDIGDMQIKPFAIPHDASDPCGFSITSNGKKIGVATDIGHLENSIIDNLAGSNFALIEANYEPEMLKCSKYPYDLKRRILGPYGHLSNEESGQMISTLVSQGVDNIALGHLSKMNNFPELAYKTVMEEIISNKVDADKLTLSVADRNKPDNLTDIA